VCCGIMSFRPRIHHNVSEPSNMMKNVKISPLAGNGGGDAGQSQNQMFYTEDDYKAEEHLNKKFFPYLGSNDPYISEDHEAKKQYKKVVRRFLDGTEKCSYQIKNYDIIGGTGRNSDPTDRPFISIQLEVLRESLKTQTTLPSRHSIYWFLQKNDYREMLKQHGLTDPQIKEHFEKYPGNLQVIAADLWYIWEKYYLLVYYLLVREQSSRQKKAVDEFIHTLKEVKEMGEVKWMRKGSEVNYQYFLTGRKSQLPPSNHMGVPCVIFGNRRQL